MNIFSQKNLNISAIKNKWLLSWFLMIRLWLKIMLFIFMGNKVLIFSSAKGFSCMCGLNKNCFINHGVIHRNGMLQHEYQVAATEIYPTLHKINQSGARENKTCTLGRAVINIYTTKLWMAIFLFVQKYC